MPIFKIFRAIAKPIVLFSENLFNTRPIERSPEEQQKVDTETSKMAIYEYCGCPFCMKTRRAIRRLNLNIELRDALNDQEHKQTLLEQGGKSQVPCLRISREEGDTWMYESGDIIQHLEGRFGEQAAH